MKFAWEHATLFITVKKKPAKVIIDIEWALVNFYSKDEVPTRNKLIPILESTTDVNFIVENGTCFPKSWTPEEVKSCLIKNGLPEKLASIFKRKVEQTTQNKQFYNSLLQ